METEPLNQPDKLGPLQKARQSLAEARQSLPIAQRFVRRSKWGSKCEFLLAVTGFVVDLANVWRFPYICYRNGGVVTGRFDPNTSWYHGSQSERTPETERTVIEKESQSATLVRLGPNGAVTNECFSSGGAPTLALFDPSIAMQPFVKPREQWANKCEFLLAVIGFAVDLGNVWRFPYVCYRNGGGAFLIPYMIMFIFGGLPLFYMELALGQYHRNGCISIWKKICPIFKGVGLAICIVNSFVAFFYNTILSWACVYLYRSFAWEVPWKHCNNAWNTPNCTEAEDAILAANATVPNDSNWRWVSPAQEFHLREILHIQNNETGGYYDMNDLGPIRLELALSLLAIFFVVYFALWKGPSSAGKAVWVTATLPYVVLTILLIRGVTLPGAMKGIKYYLTPQWDRLLDRKVWIDAASQIFFSLGPGFGVLLAFASYNDKHNNFVKDAIITSIINCFTSFLSGFVIFSVLGYMSHTLNRKIEEVTTDGPGLIFEVYPQAIATMAGSSFWAIIFFLMLIMLGLDSTFGGLESVITGFCDEFPNAIGKKREIFVLFLMVYCFLGGLVTTTCGGSTLIDFLDNYGVQITLITAVFLESVAVCWFYGVTRFSSDVEEMLGHKPGIGWRTCWTFISPVFIFIILVFAVIDMKPLTGYPDWSVYLGWGLRMLSLSLIPLYAIYKIASLKGSVMERLRAAITPEEPPANPVQITNTRSISDYQVEFKQIDNEVEVPIRATHTQPLARL